MRVTKPGITSVLTSLVVFEMAVMADTATLTPSKDNSIFSSDTETSNAQGDLFCGTTGGGIAQRCLLAFDLSEDVPAGSTVTSASLTLTLVRASKEGSPDEMEIHRLAGDWGEGTSSAEGGGGGPATAGDVTWTSRFFGEDDRAWESAGGDFDDTAGAVETIGTAPGPYTWASTERLVADVQGWLDDPESNFGWIVLGNETQFNTARRFASHENDNAADRPVLTVEFDPPATDGNGDGSQTGTDDGGGSPTGACGAGLMGSALMCLLALGGCRFTRHRNYY